MRAQQLPRLGVKHRLDHALRLTKRYRFAIANKREATNLNVITRLFCLGLGQTHTRHLRMAIGAPRNRARLDRVHFMPRDQLCHHNALMAGLVSQPRCSGNIANGKHPLDARAAVFICHHMGAIHLHTNRFQPKVLDIADNANRRNHCVELAHLDLATNLDMRAHTHARLAVKFLDPCLFQNGHALLHKLLLCKAADLSILHRQDPVHDLHHRSICAQRIVKAGKLYADRARSNHQ